jgi:release factor glutamine methyltransferase
MAEALHIDRDKLILSPPDREVPDRFWDMVERRKAGEPVAYITGRRAFWNIELHVGPGVLVPRPIRRCWSRRRSSISKARADRGASSTSEPVRARFCSPRSMSGPPLPASESTWPARLGFCCSQRSPARIRKQGKAGAGNWAEGLRETFDLILCNPPYIAEGAELGRGVREYEPDEALFAGREGLDAYRALAPQLPHLLNEGGLAAIEIGMTRPRQSGDCWLAMD